MQRFMIVVCIIAALVLVVLKPARGAPTDAQKCVAAKLSATGRYSLCLMQAQARAERTGGPVDFGACSPMHTRAFQRSETKYGEACATSGDAASIQIAVGAAADNLGCLLGFTDGGARWVLRS